MVNGQAQLVELAQRAVATVCDPEIPTVGIVDLGIVRSIDFIGGLIVVTITPTYSGCPAMQMIEKEIEKALRAVGVTEFRIEKVLSPAWTSDWISMRGREMLKESGIAPPELRTEHEPVAVEIAPAGIKCPICGSVETALASEFGSTACKAVYRCSNCSSTFDYIKPI